MALENQQAAADYAPLRHWDELALAFVADKVGQALQGWRAQWSTAPTPAAVETRAAACILVPPERLGRGYRLQAAAAWLVWETSSDGRAPQAAQLVGPLVYGGNGAVGQGSIAAELCREALAHLAAALRIALALDPEIAAGVDLESAAEPLPQAAFGVWSGGVRVSLPGLDGLALYLSGPTVARLNPPRRAAAPAHRPALSPIREAVGDAVVSLGAQLRPVELTLGQIGSLQVGDVVVLPHALDLPLQVVNGSGAMLCEAYLGCGDACRALELLPPQGSPADA